MALKSLFPVVVTSKVAEVRDFYVQHFGFRVVFEADWYVQLHGLRGDGVPPVELAFMMPNVESQPALLHTAFSGAGLLLTMDVDDVDAVHRTLSEAGALKDVVVSLRDEPWGQRHFLFKDPCGHAARCCSADTASVRIRRGVLDPRGVRP
jgi:catechol 2,3-dioxygenase-like lactoylglutathione lyase family enzyme